MVRNRQPAKEKIDATVVSEAIDLIKSGTLISGAARSKGLSYGTLHRYYNASLACAGTFTPNPGGYNARQVFSPAMEEELVGYVITCAQMFYGLTIVDFRQLAFQLAKKNELKYPTKWDNAEMAGVEWYYSFMKRHRNLSLRVPEGCSLSRATSFNEHNVTKFYDNLSNLYSRFPSFANGTRVWNLDEKGCLTVQKACRKVIAEKGVRQCSKLTSAERGTLSTICCFVSAAGTFIPPALIFPRKNFKPNMIIGAPPGTLGLAGSSGWMTADLFVQVIEHFINSTGTTPENPSLLIFDNHESHLSSLAITLAKDHGVQILTIPPHCTNKLQPLDVGIYGPFQTYYDSALDSRMSHHPGQTFTIYNVGACVGLAHAKALTPSNIISAFQSTGIYPFDRYLFTAADFMSSSVTDRPDPSLVPDAPPVVPPNQLPAAPTNQLPAAPLAAPINQLLAVPPAAPTNQLPAAPVNQLLAAPTNQLPAAPAEKKRKPRKKPTVYFNPSVAQVSVAALATGNVIQSIATVSASNTSAPELPSTSGVTTVLAGSKTPISKVPSSSTTPTSATAVTPSSETPHSKKARFIPEEVMPYPKAGKRQGTKKGREKGRSFIPTDTPEKNLLLKKAHEKAEKLRKQLEKRLAKENGQPQVKKSKQVRKALFSDDDSDSDSDDLSLIDESSGPEHFSSSSDESDHLPEIDELSKDGVVAVDKFVLIEFLNGKFYVGKITEIFDNGEFQVKYLRRSQKHEGKFTYPPIDDIDTKKRNDIFAFLPDPEKSGTTARLQSLIAFPIKLTNAIR